MEFGIILLIIIYLIYFLLIKGALWKLIIFTAGWFGLNIALRTWFPESEAICFMNFTWAEVIPTAIVLLAMANTKDE